MPDEETTELLREAVKLLRIIARPQMLEIRGRFEAGMLSSPKRREMWEAMDGTRSVPDIAKHVGTSTEAVRVFAKDVQEKFPDFIELDRVGGGAQMPRRTLI